MSGKVLYSVLGEECPGWQLREAGYLTFHPGPRLTIDHPADPLKVLIARAKGHRVFADDELGGAVLRPIEGFLAGLLEIGSRNLLPPAAVAGVGAVENDRARPVNENAGVQVPDPFGGEGLAVAFAAAPLAASLARAAVRLSWRLAGWQCPSVVGI